MSRGAILFVDDEKDLRDSAVEWLSLSGFEVLSSASATDAIAVLGGRRFDALVTDIRMPGMDGMALLDAARSDNPDLPVVLLTGHGDVALAVDAMRRGAHDFLEKPYDADHLVAVLDRAVEARRLRGELDRLRQAEGTAVDLEARMIGNASAIVRLRERLLQLSDIDVDVLIQGETGTGKEVAARALHDCGKRAGRPFVAINCAAVPETVFESELFGHERGAFTGAVARRTGRIAHANGGTVFLDEIESMPAALQAKLLRVIQERVVGPIGSNRELPVDVRFVAASKTPLAAAARDGSFRSDLYFRLATVTLELPPLDRRREDIPLLFAHFAAEAARKHGLAPRDIPQAVLAGLGMGRWEGNVRELRGAAERFVLGLQVRPAVTGQADATGETNLSDAVSAFEAALIAEALEAVGGNVREASNRLGLPRRTLSEKIARYGLRGDESAAEGARSRQ